MTVRIGLLAASRIAVPAVIEPAPLVDGVEITSVGARELARAQEYSSEWSIPHAFGSYAELATSEQVDAVYIGTPASLHREWAIAAIESGKHVLCEKPFAANAADARRIADAARASDVVVMEAYHWRYHPYVHQMQAVLDSGVLGDVRRVEAVFDIPAGVIPRDDIRWTLAIGGGSTMDLGCYPIQWVRWAMGCVDPEVVSATAVCPVDGVDGSLGAELRWPSGVTGWIHSSMIADGDDVVTWLRVEGTDGTMTATNPLAPQHGGALLTVATADGVTTEQPDRSTTYYHQLVAFRDAIASGEPFPTTADDGVRTMAVIDACYLAAGLPVRPTIG